jgi:peptide/nickel transport system permease protein
VARFVVVRLVQAVGIVFLVASFTFFLIHIAPGDPFVGLTETSSVPPQVREQLQKNFGLDRPLVEQYVRYLANVATGNLGYSFSERRPVAQALADRIPETLLLAMAGIVFAFGVGIPIGAIQGWKSGSRTDHTLTLTSLTLYSLPVFWLGIMLQLTFGVKLGMFPVSGALDPITHDSLTLVGRLWDRAVHLVLPALTLGLVGAAAFARFQRSATLDVIVQDFVRTARGKGLPERLVLFRHALRASLIPSITLLGLTFPILLSGAVLVETVFSWPGMGRLAVNAIAARDYYVVTGTTIVAATMVVIGNLIADILYRLADPRTQASPS